MEIAWNPWVEIDRRPDLEVMFLPIPIPGMYDPDRKVIVVSMGLSDAMVRSVLTEELAHHELGHRPSCPAETARMELRARRWAARRLIPLDELAGAMGGMDSWDDVAVDLEVDPMMLRTRIGALTPGEQDELAGLLGGYETGV